MSFNDLTGGRRPTERQLLSAERTRSHRLSLTPFRQWCLKDHYSQYPPVAIAFIMRVILRSLRNTRDAALVADRHSP